MSPDTPYVQPLPRAHRRFVFALSVTLFAVLVPSLVFYAVGYRFDFSEGGGVRNIMSVGGMYINTDADDVSIYIDDEPVENLRIFQRAAYIQNLEAGVHQVHVQGEGVQTWVKQLPVFSHYVTEAAAFNMPLVPQIRLITKYQTMSGEIVVDATSTPPLSIASTSQRMVVATSTMATTSFSVNPEYTYIAGRFASTTEERTLMNQVKDFAAEPFAFSDERPEVMPTTTATSTIRSGDMELRERGDDVYASWVGDTRDIPYYFCVNPAASSSPAFYGSHVTAQLFAAASTTLLDMPQAPVIETSNRICRTEIRIDRKWQDVRWFAFVPGSRDLVLMHLEDGLHVVEIDDRSWQNTQLLYPGRDLNVMVDGGRIMVQDGQSFFEVFTELPN